MFVIVEERTMNYKALVDSCRICNHTTFLIFNIIIFFNREPNAYNREYTNFDSNLLLQRIFVVRLKFEELPNVDGG